MMKNLWFSINCALFWRTLQVNKALEALRLKAWKIMQIQWEKSALFDFFWATPQSDKYSKIFMGIVQNQNGENERNCTNIKASKGQKLTYRIKGKRHSSQKLKQQSIQCTVGYFTLIWLIFRQCSLVSLEKCWTYSNSFVIILYFSESFFKPFLV